MVDTPVEKSPVVRDEDKALFLFQIRGQKPAPFLIQMIRRLVDEQKEIFSKKQRRQQNLRLFSERKLGKWPIKRLLRAEN